MKARLHNLTPNGVAFADSEYIGFHSGASPSYHLTSHITTGEWPYWQNTGNDDKGLIHRRRSRIMRRAGDHGLAKTARNRSALDGG